MAKCDRCSETARVYVTEAIDGEVRESRLCEAHAREASIVAPVRRADDGHHARIGVTARQLERPEDITVRFPDGFETDLGDVWHSFTDGRLDAIRRSADGTETHVSILIDELPKDIPATVDIVREDTGERYTVLLELMPDPPEEGSRPACADGCGRPD